jgi:hypothetical protein
MGSNSTQGQAVLVFLVAFVCIVGGLAGDISYLWLILGLVLLAVSAGLFLKCKPWEQKES